MTDRRVPLIEVAQRSAKSDESVIAISPYCVVRVMPDRSVLLYRDNGIETTMISLSRDYIIALEKLVR